MTDNTKVTRKYLFRGRVQGVSFRWTTQQIALNHPVTGYVRNLPDGRVELVVHGDAQAIDEFRLHVEKRFQNHIVEMEEGVYSDAETFRGFDVRT